MTLLHGRENKRKQKQISFQFSAYQLYSEKAETMLEIENLSEIGGSRKMSRKTRNPFNLMWQLLLIILKIRANCNRFDCSISRFIGFSSQIFNSRLCCLVCNHRRKHGRAEQNGFKAFMKFYSILCSNTLSQIILTENLRILIS